jgi:hypothetical protein
MGYFLHARVPPGETAAVVNLDETSIRLYQDAGPGFVVEVARKQRRTNKSMNKDVTKGQLRRSFTLIAMITSDGTLQQHLPQIAFINACHIAQDVFNGIVKDMLPNVHVFRVNNSWTTVDKMKRVLGLLNTAVKNQGHHRRILLCADTYKAHMSDSVFMSAAKHGIFYFTVPPKMTWALQPCDTHVFATFKHHLAVASQRISLSTASGKLTMEGLLTAMNETIRLVLNERSWSKAFIDVGLTGSQANLSHGLMESLSFDVAPGVGTNIPTLHQLQACFPKGWNIAIGWLFAAAVQADNTKQTAACSAAPVAMQISEPSQTAPQTFGVAPSSAPTASSHGQLAPEGPCPRAVRLGPLQPLPPPAQQTLPHMHLQLCPPPAGTLPRLQRLPSWTPPTPKPL